MSRVFHALMRPMFFFGRQTLVATPPHKDPIVRPYIVFVCAQKTYMLNSPLQRVFMA